MNLRKTEYDVAIIGVGLGANYGSVLTYYSLYKTIEDFGKKVLMVSKIGASVDDPEIGNTHATRFARENYNLSKLYSKTTVKELNEIVDTFVIGSDQVWNYGVSKGFGKAFYLDFVNDERRKISYAASFGHAKDFAPEEERVKITELMKRFNAISVREDVGVEMARDIYQVSAVQVSEPIFLLPTEEYLRLASISKRDVSGSYLLAYILDPTPEKKAAIEHMAKKNGLKVRVILDGWPNIFSDNKKKMDLPDAVEEGVEVYDFLKLYANSSYVVTDSFHGTAFALKFGKPFASIGNVRRGVARFNSMFRLIGHGERFTLEPIKIVNEDERFLVPLDYVKINEALDRQVKESKDWLKSSLEKPVADLNPVINSSKYYEVANFVKKLTRDASVLLKDVVRKKSYRIDKPIFEASNKVWHVSEIVNATRITVSEMGETIRGNLVWCELPVKLQPNNSYRISVSWLPRTLGKNVNFHVRNSATGKFKVIGTVKPKSNPDVFDLEVIDFSVADDGYDQFMLGAIHFTGVNAGADISFVELIDFGVRDRFIKDSNKISPKSPVEVAKDLGEKDNARFIDFYAQKRISRNFGNARSLLMYYAHGFEKGLSRRNFRPGFGESSMPLLAKEMNRWINAGRSHSDSFFQIAASVMRVYFERHKKLNVDVSHFFALFDPKVQIIINNANKQFGGALEVGLDREVVVDGEARNFLDVVFGRRSVREFTSASVSNEDIEKAVQIALQAPSVCNRQPVRVHQFDDPTVMKAALDLQGGFRGYEMPPKLLLVTSDLAAFVAAVERNQAFIDGGLFMMLLLLGLEQVGLGACSLNTAMGAEREETIRKILNIPDSEVFISFIAVGHFQSNVLTPRSKRIAVNEVLIPHSSEK